MSASTVSGLAKMAVASIKTMLKCGQIGVVVLLGATLMACSDSGIGDLESFVAETKMKKGAVEPLPEFKTAETYKYSANSLRDPFSTFRSEVKTTAKTQSMVEGVRPNVNRRKEVLENFPLDALKMIGTLEFNQQVWGLVKAPDGIIYRVRPDNHLGQNYGKISRVLEAKLLLSEIVPDGLGGWEERQASLSVDEIK